MIEIMYAMMVWISSVSGLAVTEAPLYSPVYVNERVLKYLMNGCSNEKNRERCKALVDEKSNGNILGIYDQNTNNIYLNSIIRTWDKDVQNSILIHELVHYMQFENNVPYRCIGQLEKLAYEVQSKWLKKHGKRDVYKELSISPLWMIFTTSCDESETLWLVPPDSESTAK